MNKTLHLTRGKYTFYVNDLSKKKNYPDRRRDYRKPVSVTTINNYVRNIRVFFNWMERDYIIRKNPMKKIRQLKNNRQAKVFLSDEDLKKLLSKFDKSYFTEHRDNVMIRLCVTFHVDFGKFRIALSLFVQNLNTLHSIQSISNGVISTALPGEHIVKTVIFSPK